MKPAHIGLFGKLPTAGDFVSRGLPRGIVQLWDLWITRHVMSGIGRDCGWPPGGMRFAFATRLQPSWWTGIALPSQDRPGRQFPLTVLAGFVEPPEPGAIDRWLTARLPDIEAAVRGEIDAEALEQALAAHPPNVAISDPPYEDLLVWRMDDDGADMALLGEPASALQKFFAV